MNQDKSKRVLFRILIILLYTITDLKISVALTIEPSAGTLQVAQVIFRHGERNIAGPYPTDPNADESLWPGGFLQLTCRGKVQGYALGRYLHQRYGGFINDTYNQKEIYVISSDMDRTIETANSVLAGLYSPKGATAVNNNNDCGLIQWTSIPVHSIAYRIDNILYYQAECQRHKWLQDDFNRNSAIMKDTLEKNRDLFNYLEENSGAEIKSLLDFVYYYDALIIENNFNMTLPKWTEKIVSSENANSFLNLYFQSTTYTNEMKRLRGGPLVNELIQNFDKIREIAPVSVQTSKDSAKPIGPKKLYLMSGHDKTIYTLLDTLGLYVNITRPGHTATVFFELYGDQSQAREDLTVQVSYRAEGENEAKHLEFPECESPCKYSKLLEILEPIRPKDWAAECQLSPESQSTFSTGMWVTVCVAGVVILFLMAFLLRAVKKRTKLSYSPL